MAEETNDTVEEVVPEPVRTFVTFDEVLRELKWWWLPSSIGALSILAIWQTVLDYGFIGVFQKVIDFYKGFMDALHRTVEPWLQPLLVWLNARLDWHLSLDPVWSPIFALLMMLILGTFRAWWSEAKGAAAKAKEVWELILGGAAMGIVAVSIGLMEGSLSSLTGETQDPHGLMTGLVLIGLSGLMLILAAVFVMRWLIQLIRLIRRHGLIAFLSDPAFNLGMAIVFIVSVTLSRSPVVLFMATTLVAGLTALLQGRIFGRRKSMLSGINILGGFSLAVVVLIADIAVKHLL